MSTGNTAVKCLFALVVLSQAKSCGQATVHEAKKAANPVPCVTLSGILDQGTQIGDC